MLILYQVWVKKERLPATRHVRGGVGSGLLEVVGYNVDGAVRA
jgi:hypothetical protein